MQTFKLVITAAIVFFILDSIWLGLLAKPLYMQHYGEWLRMNQGEFKPLWPAALMVYFLLVLGIIIFVLPLSQGQLLYALLYGALFGLITYGIYDFTCLAVFKNISVFISIIDCIWGTILCGCASVATVWVSQLS